MFKEQTAEGSGGGGRRIDTHDAFIEAKPKDLKRLPLNHRRPRK